MYLKRVEVKGFKSFADKVELELNKGITGVVGPNGSGKSNISDAVRWVLGEQSARTLRGMKMEDVIFAGTNIRKPLGFAEVSITIDNTDNMLPVDYSEITVTRRMYRSGESEYFINHTNCRLKDITELFMDTGVGRDGYSIIGQGRIDEILNAKAEDRREIFEEAAGIVKYKTRKMEAEKRLEVTQQNITRLADIVNELETQLNPLLEQSDIAKKYLGLKERLKTLEINIFIKNIDKTKEKISSLAENSLNLESELLDNNRKNARLEEDYTKLRLLLQNIDEQIENFQDKLYKADNDMEKNMGETKLLNEKKANLLKNIARLDDDIKRENQDLDTYKKLLEESTNSLRSLEDLISENQNILNIKDSAFQDINSLINEKESLIENLKTEVIELLNKIADKKSSINSLTTFRGSIDKRKVQIDNEIVNKNNRISELEDSLRELGQENESYSKNLKTITETISQIDGSIINSYNEKKLAEKALYELNDKIQSRQARYKILCEMENEFEGYNRSVKEIMKYKSSGRGIAPRICGVVADLIHVDEKHEIAIEAALGSALQNIVTEDEYAAKECIEFLKVNKYGRATFLPLSTIIAKNISSNEKLKQNKGFIGFASDLVSYDKKFYSIILSLLGRVIVVDNMDNGIITARNTNYTMKIVTLDGDIISPGGAFTGGSINIRTGKILSRKREIDELERDLKEIRDSASLANDKKTAIERKIADFEEELKKLTQEKHMSEIQQSTCINKFNAVNSEMERVKEDLKNLDLEISQLMMEEKEAGERADEETLKLSELEARSGEISGVIQYEQSGIKDVLSKKEELISEITSLKVKIAEYRQGNSTLCEKIQEVELSIEKCISGINSKKDEIIKEEEQIKNIQSSESDIVSLLKNIISNKETVRKQLDEVNENKRISSRKMDELEAKRKEYSEACGILQDEIHKLEMQKTRLDMEMENLQNRIWEEYELSYAGAQKYKIEIGNVNQAVKDISSIKDEIKELGIVNVGAIEEYKRVKERYEFLLKQNSDLEEAKDSLQKVILEMTDKMQVQFIKNFAIINENFNATFQQLFGGGRAELILCNKEDVLQSGIEIVAEPPGKKLQSLTLLSGGEKALTAIALLFGILRMKPSPFCILDEIEAALDDVNVARYARFLKELARETQFIIVTHRKGTMEIADVLYGVTMEEKGVSRLVSVKLSEKAS